MALLTQDYAMPQRNLVGQKKAMAMAVRNHLGRKRYTRLAEWLSGCPGPGFQRLEQWST